MRVRHARRWSLARQLLWVQLSGFVVLVAVGSGLAYLDAVRAVDDRAREQVIAVAATLADTPTLRTAVVEPAPTQVLQPLAERVRADTGVDFITIMNPDAIRFTHPDPAQIGQRFIGNTAEALRGHMFTETYAGTLGPSMRAVAPVFDDSRRVVALVAVGIRITAISAELAERLRPLLTVAAAVLVVGAAGSVLISRRLNRETRGLAPAELSRVFTSYEATLHAVREGLILIQADGRVALCNDGARELLGLSADPADPVGREVAELDLPESLVEALRAAEPRTDEIHLTDTRVLVLNSAPVRAGNQASTVVTLRDHTDLQRLSGELTTTRGLAESLRAQAHEAANRLHTVVSLVEMGRADEAVEFAAAELAIAQRLTDRVVSAVDDPVLAALLLGKAAEAHERGVELVITEDSEVGDPVIDPRALVTIVGNLVDNAVDAALEAEGPPRVTVTIRSDGTDLLLRVADTGPGVADVARAEVFRRGWSTKGEAGQGVGRGIGLALVGQAVRQHGGSIDLVNSGGAVFTVRLPFRPREAP
ncbi:sensor histidine kinase [Pseudonocardia eucalypti]|uniref:histidine kinase n=1 Tax=Pseudonocardia eucalypti TaxID=648755 RepID=A0ABP9PN02_9PSEU|nr:sensor histidine kinase regulating citrate/malate metabolism [Pseudonocardia eucalypti]